MLRGRKKAFGRLDIRLKRCHDRDIKRKQNENQPQNQNEIGKYPNFFLFCHVLTPPSSYS